MSTIEEAIEASVRRVLEDMGLINILSDLVDVMKPPEIMTHTQAARYLGRSAGWLYQHTEVPRHKNKGSETTFFRAELDAWVQNQVDADKWKTHSNKSCKKKLSVS